MLKTLRLIIVTLLYRFADCHSATKKRIAAIAAHCQNQTAQRDLFAHG